MPTKTSASILALAPVIAFTSGPLERYIDDDLQKARKLASKSFAKGQEYSLFQANFVFQKQLLKACFFNLYYKNPHLDYYYYCQKFKDYFKTVKAN